VIVAGDFNTYWGDHEIYLFTQAAGLTSANTRGLPSYPSRSPRKELDFILHSAQIEVNRFEIPDVQFRSSALICDFTIHERTRLQGRLMSNQAGRWNRRRAHCLAHAIRRALRPTCLSGGHARTGGRS
jgi:hypothetical protein